MPYLAVLLVAALVFGVCYLFDKGFEKMFRSQAQHYSGLSVRLNKRYAAFGAVFIAIGAAAGLHRLVAENSLEQSLENGKKLLLQTSGLDENNDLTAMILKTYQMILDGCSIAELCKSAEEAKAMLAERVI